MLSSRGSSWPRIEPTALCLLQGQVGSLPPAPPGKPQTLMVNSFKNLSFFGVSHLQLKLKNTDLNFNEQTLSHFDLKNSSKLNTVVIGWIFFVKGGHTYELLQSLHYVKVTATASCVSHEALYPQAWWWISTEAQLENEMATHSSVLAWRIPGTREPGGLPSMGSHRVGHDWSDLAAATAQWHKKQTDKTIKKISKSIIVLNDTVDQLYLLDIHRSYHLTRQNFNFFEVHM